MPYLVTAIDMTVAAVFWLTLAVGGFLFYRAFHLRVLPWLGCYLVASYASANLMYLYFHPFSQSSGHPVDLHSGVVSAAMITDIIEHTANLLAVVLALSEVAVLGARAQAGVVPSGLRCFVLVHAYTRALGITLLILALALPLPAIIYYYTHR